MNIVFWLLVVLVLVLVWLGGGGALEELKAVSGVIQG